MISEENQDFCNAALRRNSGFLPSCARRNHEIVQDFSEKRIQNFCRASDEEVLPFLHKELKVQC